MNKYVMAMTAAITLGMLAPATAAADSQNGSIGGYSVTDSATAPGATCIYQGTWGPLHAVRVPAPRLFARDTTAQIDNGQVGWRFIVKRVAQTTTVVYRSTIETASATDDSAAVLEDMTRTFAPGGSGRYIVVVKMFWYGANGRVTGWVKHRNTHYARVDETGNEAANGRSCPLGFA